MRNEADWCPTKFIYRRNKLVASRGPGGVGFGSRLAADLGAAYYDKYLRIYARGKLIDLGCGPAPLYATYRRFVTEIVCVDWENTMHKNSYLDLECDLAKPLPFEDRQFNTIILSDVLEHIPEPQILWNEMSRILGQNGKLIMNVPFYYSLHEEPYDFYRYTEFALRRFAEVAGLQVLLLEACGGVPEILGDILAKNALRIPRIGKPIALLAQSLVALFLKTKVGQKVSRSSSARFPFGYFLIAEKVSIAGR